MKLTIFCRKKKAKRWVPKIKKNLMTFIEEKWKISENFWRTTKITSMKKLSSKFCKAMVRLTSALNMQKWCKGTIPWLFTTSINKNMIKLCKRWQRSKMKPNEMKPCSSMPPFLFQNAQNWQLMSWESLNIKKLRLINSCQLLWTSKRKMTEKWLLNTSLTSASTPETINRKQFITWHSFSIQR